jgi:FkbM family methyltransferase
MNHGKNIEEFIDGNLLKACQKNSELEILKKTLQSPIVIYGAGVIAKEIISKLSKIITIAAVADQNSEILGSEIQGIKILSLDEAINLYGKDHLFVVSVIRNYKQIECNLKKQGCKIITYFLPMFWIFHKKILPYYNLDLPVNIYDQKTNVVKAYYLFDDDESRAEYIFQLNLMISLDERDAPPADFLENQYFDEKIINLNNNEEFVDCGSYTGDTIESFLQRTENNFKAIYAFEPDQKNLKELRAMSYRISGNKKSKFHLYDCGVGAVNETVRFSSFGNESSHISDSGEIEVKISKLDDIMHQFHPTFIKMDIEGAELDALEGAISTIQRCFPKMAICTYHRQNHLWEIPLFLKAIYPAYRIYLRRYRDSYGDVVCYAIP